MNRLLLFFVAGLGLASCGGGSGGDNPFVAVESVTISTSSKSLEAGETLQLSATISPSNATETRVSWTSSNANVASVSETGLVTAKAAGSTTVRASAGSKYAECSITVTEPAPDPEPSPSSFFYGADVSWVTEMERDGIRFKNASGAETDLFTLLSSVGVNAIRLRVFVDGPEAWSETEDVVAKAVRAKAAGMDVMIDFHYSDFFADPGRQTVPASWKGQILSQLCASVASHTADVLKALKSAGVSPKWIQIGNETTDGMLWDFGRLSKTDGYANFAALYASGYDTAKSIFPEAAVMPHIDNAYKDHRDLFAKLRSAGVKMDMVALSHYPMSSDDADWKAFNSSAITQIKALVAALGVPVMVSEVGIRLTRWNGTSMVSQEAEAKSCLSEFVTALKAIDGSAGIFYWEPEVYGGWKPSVYKDVSAYVPGDKEWGAYTMGAFTSEGKPSSVFDAYK